MSLKTKDGSAPSVVSCAVVLYRPVANLTGLFFLIIILCWFLILRQAL